MKLQIVAAVTSLVSSVAASTLNPPVLPLIVRNPYLSTWLGNARDNPWSKWPMFYTGEEIGFSVLASVPETRHTYPLLGRPQDSLDEDDHTYNISYPVYKGAQYDASLRLLPLSANLFRPRTSVSMPQEHLTLTFWDLENSETEKLKSWVVKRKDELLFTEWSDRAEWGSLRFTGPSDVRHESGTSGVLRNRFFRTGTLQNENDNHFRSIMRDEPVFAFSKSFNLAPNVTSHKKATSESALFTIAHIQDPVTQYASARGLTFMRPLWKTCLRRTTLTSSLLTHTSLAPTPMSISLLFPLVRPWELLASQAPRITPFSSSKRSPPMVTVRLSMSSFQLSLSSSTLNLDGWHTFSSPCLSTCFLANIQTTTACTI
ncbi:putative glutaminase, partial [Aureobasidium melanogenum]